MTMEYRQEFAAPGEPLSARALNELWAEVRRLGARQNGGGTDSPEGFNPDDTKGFWAKITAVGSSGYHSWERVRWNSATNAWISYPSPGPKGHKDTNAAYEPNGQSCSVNDIVWLEPIGVRKVSTSYWPVYGIRSQKSAGSGIGAGTVGENCQGYYNGGSRVTTGGAFGYGYTEVSVPVGASTTPYSTLEIWRLHHGAEPNTTFGPWAANKYQPTSGYVIPTMPTTLVGGFSVPNRLRFMGKRGDLVSGTTYNCYQYSLLSFSIGGTVRFNNGSGWFSLYGQTDLYFESYQQNPLIANQSGYMFATTNTWDALYNGSATGWQYANMAWSESFKGDETVRALIGFDQDIGWHIRAVQGSDYRINGRNKNSTGVTG